MDELTDNLGYEYFNNGSLETYVLTSNAPDWIYNNKYNYWTMSQCNDSDLSAWYVSSSGYLQGREHNSGNYGDGVYEDDSVRPVVTILKSAL